MAQFFESHTGALLLLILLALVLLTLLIIVPQLLRARHHANELQHAENMRALEQGKDLVPADERSRLAGRTASLVPMVSVCAAATVTCFLAAFQSQYTFSVSLAAWCVAGVVSLAAITGGVALMGRLAQLQWGEDEDERDKMTR